MSFHTPRLCFSVCTDVTLCIYDALFVGLFGLLNSYIFGEGWLMNLEVHVFCYDILTEFSYVLCIGTSVGYDLET